MFSDKTIITVRSGKGGDGHVSFRREKYVPNGGPDGGDGGKGGDVIFEIDEGETTLVKLRHKHKYFAQDGECGRKEKCHGKNGKDVVIKVPEGTLIREAKSNKVIADMSGEPRRRVLLKGGRGGRGNQHYATSTTQAPRYAEPGRPGIELELNLELKMIADVGLVGFPNAGKSTFLSRISNARPKIADYPFTTLFPHLGVVDLDGEYSFIIADIPGLIEGASAGLGLGHDFLRHIERTLVLVHMVDISSPDERDPISAIRAINSELASYSEALEKKPQLIAANKIDVLSPEEADRVIAYIRREFEPMGYQVFPISAVSGSGVNELLYALYNTLIEHKSEKTVFKQEYFPDDTAPINETYTVVYDEKKDEYIVEGSLIEHMLDRTRLDSEKGFVFFQRFLDREGITERLKDMGVKAGDTIRMYGHTFEYFD